MDHPVVFGTTTCSPAWSKNTKKLLQNQKVEHRPDHCARVFHMKLQEIIRSIQVEEIFGKGIAHVQVIEFQKDVCLMLFAYAS